MSLYCGTLDVYYSSQTRYDQFRDIFGSLANYENWMVGTLIPDAMRVIDQYAGHDFLSHSGTILLDGNGKKWLPITREGRMDDGSGYEVMEHLPLPLITITSINDNSTAITNYLTYHSYIKRDSGVFRRDEQNIAILGTWGYASVPGDIRQVTARMCANFIGEMLRMRNLPDLVTAVQSGAGNLEPIFRSPRVLTKNETIILERYRFKELMMA